MKVLWLCNIILPKVAALMGVRASNKEGWLSGALEAVEKCGDIELGICFPVDKSHDGYFLKDVHSYFGFYENTGSPEIYDPTLEERLARIADSFKPDVVHIFGTEYPHTLAMAKVFADKPGRVLVGIQGVLDIYRSHFFDGLPQQVIDRVTFRDLLRRDSLKLQQRKYELRAVNEIEALKLVGNVTGRTPFDKEFTQRVAPGAKYFYMNETLRGEFYKAIRDDREFEEYSVFLSQGNYPIKGAHYMIEALTEIKKQYPQTKVYIAGDNITRHGSFKDRLKLSSYGKYLLELMQKNGLEKDIFFTGSLGTAEYIDRLKKSHVFVCPSTIENSPNSLGEAMLLHVPCVTADVGGISGIFDRDKDGIMYPAGDVKALSRAVIEVFADPKSAKDRADNAAAHAKITHDPAKNSTRLLEVYKEIFDANRICV
ncbi:MAG: glycosyltransferase family 4 protein [Lachnospiraceae bacterium]|nr:glycosyltransferase family 4 protein [Lachnospiraceae bacterium]